MIAEHLHLLQKITRRIFLSDARKIAMVIVEKPLQLGIITPHFFPDVIKRMSRNNEIGQPLNAREQDLLEDAQARTEFAASHGGVSVAEHLRYNAIFAEECRNTYSRKEARIERDCKEFSATCMRMITLCRKKNLPESDNDFSIDPIDFMDEPLED
jgi:hypothetical protein